jgi:Zn-dependent peptidase ImmA (M78 family)
MTTCANRSIITWARERNGFTIEGLATVMKIDPNEIRMWESGDKFPSYTMLEKLAYKYLKVPLAIFFFPEPPNIEDTVGKFRRLPDYELTKFSPDTIKIIRTSQGYQDSLIELISSDKKGKQIFHDINAGGLSPIQLANQVRQFLGIKIEKQFEFLGIEEAFKAWRHAIEVAGIYTFKTSFKDRFVSGFCLLHDEFPIIVINNSNSFSRQIFTLVHELGHILYNIHGITDIDDNYIEYMPDKEKLLEINCNRFASELLVPNKIFIRDIPPNFKPEIVPMLATKYSVSREVILRKLLNNNMISEEYYHSKAQELNNEYLRMPPKVKGGNWYLTQLSYLGEGFTRLAFASYYSGQTSKEQLAQHLNINAKNIDKLESYIFR